METYKGKTVVVLGLSVEGEDSARFFASEGATVICADRRTKDALGSLYERLRPYAETFDLGPSDQFRHIRDADFIVRSPGITLQTPQLQDAVRHGVELTSQTKLFFRLCPAPIIGVTGTKGKGTTSTLIYEMLQKGGKTAYLGGNVGIPLLSRVRQIKPNDWVVLELSSFQLEDLSQSPHIAVVLRVTQDHLANYDALATNYHKTRDDYVKAKKNIVRFQTADDVVILNKDDETSRSFGLETPARSYFVSRYRTDADSYVRDHAVFVKHQEKETVFVRADEIRLRGDHNLENIAAAYVAATAAGVDMQSIRDAAVAFQGLPHRLEEVGTIGGVTFINDSFSTVPETTIAAIESFEAPMILIVGGAEKGSDFTQMGKRIAELPVKKVIVIGQMTGRIIDALQKASYTGAVVQGFGDMQHIVEEAYKDAKPGDVVLLSPGCASFDMFPNYKERGKQFIYEVSKLSQA